MGGVHEVHQLQPEFNQRYIRLIPARGGITGLPSALNFQEPRHATEYIQSGEVPWLTQPSPTIAYRPIRPSDLDVLRELHEALFPVKYETDFFLTVVHGHGTISWVAVDTSRAGVLRDEMIGFVTTRVVSTAEIDTTGMFGYEFGESEKDLVYILTLGVIRSYRNLGIASSLIHRVLDYASTIPTCQAVYLHVISYNTTAINFYEKCSFRCLQRVQNFYRINDHPYDAYLYIYYINGGRAPCSALDFFVSVSSLLKHFVTSMAGWFQRKVSRNTGKWAKLKESGFLDSLGQSRTSTDSSTSLSV